MDVNKQDLYRQVEVQDIFDDNLGDSIAKNSIPENNSFLKHNSMTHYTKIINSLDLCHLFLLKTILLICCCWLTTHQVQAQTCAGAVKISQTQGGLDTDLHSWNRFGTRSTNLGDIDGDGINDIAVGSHGDDTDGVESRGAVYILLLNSDGSVKTTQKIAHGIGNLMASLDEYDQFGNDLAGIGDLDGDGIPDLAVGAFSDDDGGANSGAIYILFLNADGTVKSEQKLSRTSGGYPMPNTTNDYFGRRISNLGDLDGDGVTDIVTSSPEFGNDDGAIYILFLNTNGTIKSHQQISENVGGFSAGLDGQDFGTWVSSIGDLNGDGNTEIMVSLYDDEVVGSWPFSVYYNALYILFLNDNGTVNFQQKIDRYSGLNTTQTGSSSFFANPMGDVDGDGVPDLLLSRSDNNVYLFLMNSNGTVKNDIKIDLSVPEIEVLRNGGQITGQSTLLGDLDGDGKLSLTFPEQSGNDGGLGYGGLFIVDFVYNPDTEKFEFELIIPDGVINTIETTVPTVCLGDNVLTIANDSFDVIGSSTVFDGLEIGVVQWQQSTDNVTWEDIPDATTIDFEQALTMPGSVLYLRRYYEHCAGLQSYSNVVTLNAMNEAPEVSIMPLHYCPGANQTATITTEITGGATPYTYNWSPATGLSATNIAEPIVTFGSEDIYELTITGSDGCEVMATAVMIPIQADAGGDTIFICNSGGIQIGMSPIPGISGVTYTWSPTSDLSCSDCPNPIASPTSIQTYTLTIDDGNGCTNNNQVVVNPNAYHADAGPDIYLCQGDEMVIGTADQAGITYGWAPGLYIDNQSIAQPTFNSGVVPSPNPYQYTITTFDANSRSCYSVDTLLAHVAFADAGVEDTINVCNEPMQIGTPDCCGGQATYEWTILSGDANSFYDPITGLFSNTSNIPEPYVMPTTQYTNYQVRVTWGPNADNSGGADCTDTRVLGVGCIDGCPVTDATFINEVSCGVGTQGTIMKVPLDSAYWTITWSPTTNLSCSDCFEPALLADVTSDITYRVDYVSKVNNSISCFFEVDVFDSNTATPEPLAEGGVACPVSGINIGNLPVVDYSYVWAPETGLDNPNSSNPLATPAETTTYGLIVTDDVTGCMADTMVTVAVISAEGATGEDITACIGESITIGEAPITGYTYSWSPMGDLTSTNVAQPTANVTSTQTYTLTISDGGGCSSSESMILTAVNNFTVTTEDKTMCEGAATSLSVEVDGADPANLNYAWSPSGGLSATNIANPVVSGIVSNQNYTVTVTSSNGGCASTNTTTVTVNSLPTASLSPQNLCNGSVQIGLSSIAGYSYNWSPSTELDNPTSSNPNSTASSTTTYTLTITNPEGCSAEFEQIVNVSAPQIEAGSSITVCEKTAVSIGVLPAEAGAIYTWSPIDYLDNPNAAQTIARPEVTTEYTLTASIGGCTSTDIVTLYVTPGPTNVGTLDPFGVFCVSECQEIGIPNNPAHTYQWLPASAVASPNSSTTQICPTENVSLSLVITEVSSGCSETQDMDVFLTTGGDCPVPCTNPTITVRDTTICSGNMVDVSLLASTTGGTLTFHSATPPSAGNALVSTTITPTMDSIIYVLATDGTCTDTAEIMITHVSNPTITARDTTICNGNMVDMSLLASTTGGALTFHSATPPNAGNALVSTIITPTMSTIYVLATDGTCTDAAQIMITHVSNPTITARDTTTCNGNMVDVSLLASTTGGTLTFHSATPPNTGNILASTTITPTMDRIIYVLATDGTCTDTTQIMITHSIPDSIMLCSSGSNSATFTAQSGLTGVEWFNSAGTSVGTGDAVTVDANTAGMDDGNDSFYYTAQEGSGCTIGLCCPIVVQTEVCCSTIGSLITDRTICSGGLVDSLAVTTTFSNPDSIAFVYFTSAQTDPYSGGTGIETVQIASSSDTVILTDINGFTHSGGSTPDTFYVYGIAHPTPISGSCRPFEEILVHVNPCDWGDLADISATTDMDDYQTLRANNGPVHIIIPGLSLGSTIDGETDGQASNDALGDDADEDGLMMFNSLDLVPGQNFRLPFSYTNTTGNTAYVVAWVDWNGDGDFDESNEMVADWNDGITAFPDRMEVTIPSTVKLDAALGWRIRISHQDNMTPYGEQPNGEVEDYLITIACPDICLPIKTTIIKQ